MTHSLRGLVGVVSVATLVGAGCNPMASVQEQVEQKIGETVTETMVDRVSGGRVKLDASGGEIAVTDKEGKTAVRLGTNVTLPENFSKELPVYPNAKIVAAAVGQSESDESSTYILSAQSTMTESISWYEKQLVSAGWKVTATMSPGSFESRVFKKGEAMINVMIATDQAENKGEVMINATFRPKG